jgi:hypothetical protein
MKRYIAAVLIPYLLLYLSGCYSMQKVTKDEFLRASNYPKLYVKTEDKEYTFKEKSYSVTNDTILGRGLYILNIKPENDFKTFEGSIGVKEVEKITTENFNTASEKPNLIVKTKDKEYVFKFDDSTYSVRNDTIYGKGKCRLINVDYRFEGLIDVSLNDAEEIQIDKFNLATSIVLISVVVMSIVGVIAIAGGVGDSIW